MSLLFKRKNKFLYFFVITAILFFASSSFAQIVKLNKKGDNYLFQGSEDVVRGFLWGLSKQFITDNEIGTFVGEDNDILFFLDNVLGLRSTIGYEFQDDKLLRVRIFNERNYLKQQDRIEDLLAYQSILEERYGEPRTENFTWRSEYEKNFPQNWGWAVYRGNLDIEILWQTKESNVVLALRSAEKYKPKMSVTFEDNKMAEKLEEEALRPGLLAPL